MAGAPLGNQNAKQGAEWRSAIKRALSRRSGENWRKGLDELADRYIEAAALGDAWALKDIADRLDGKPKQSVDVEGGIDHVVRNLVVNSGSSE